MPTTKRSEKFRKPLTDVEELSGATYYNDTDIESILSTFERRPHFDKAAFARNLESTAWWSVNLADADPETAPSIREKDWRVFANEIRRALDRYEDLTDRQIGDLGYAARRLAKRTGALPDFPPDKIPLPPLPGTDEPRSDYITDWPVEQQLDKAIDELRWLLDCVFEAQTYAGDDKEGAGGNRPDNAKHEFFRNATMLYRRWARKPVTPKFDRTHGKFYDVELLDFLDACLIPLGIRDEIGAIYQTYRRAVWDVEKALGEHQTERSARPART